MYCNGEVISNSDILYLFVELYAPIKKHCTKADLMPWAFYTSLPLVDAENCTSRFNKKEVFRIKFSNKYMFKYIQT